MSGKRHTPGRGTPARQDPAPAPDAPGHEPRSALADTRDRGQVKRTGDDVLLDAARACVLTSGVRRTTLAQIARTAQVSRMTLYRRFPDVNSVLVALMTREFGSLVTRVSLPPDAAANARERTVRSAVAVVRALADDPLMRTVLDVDAELVLPYIVHRLGSTQIVAERVIAELLRHGHEDGSIRRGDSAAQVRSLLLVVQSFVFSLRAATSDVDEDALLAEFAHVLDATLRPVTEGASA